MRHPAVVTGGASGIGLAVVRRLLDDGWPVAIADFNGEALAEAEDVFSGEDVCFLRLDVTEEDDVEEAFDIVVDRFGLIGGLVNSAGIARTASVEDTTTEMLREMLDVNLVGSFIASKAALARMGETLSIVNISSVSGLRGSRGRLAYGASKAGLKLMSEVMAVELGAHRVRVNCIAPGPVDTPLVAKMHSDADRKAWTDQVPQRRYGEPEEVAAAVAFLISDQASYITGQTLAVDGGFAAGGILPER